jgi:hypothetical protein
LVKEGLEEREDNLVQNTENTYFYQVSAPHTKWIGLHNKPDATGEEATA